MRYYATGIICIIGSVIFGIFARVRVHIPVDGQLMEGWAPNITNIGPSIGLGIAAGLAIIAAAISENNKKGDD